MAPPYHAKGPYSRSAKTAGPSLVQPIVVPASASSEAHRGTVESELAVDRWDPSNTEALPGRTSNGPAVA